MTDADTIRNAGDLWGLVHLVQDTIDKDGIPMLVGENNLDSRKPLAALRKLADDLDPEYGRY